jgi:hypothetical protein
MQIEKIFIKHAQLFIGEYGRRREGQDIQAGGSKNHVRLDTLKGGDRLVVSV